MAATSLAWRRDFSFTGFFVVVNLKHYFYSDYKQPSYLAKALCKFIPILVKFLLIDGDLQFELGHGNRCTSLLPWKHPI